MTTKSDPLTIAGKQFRSRLIVGTGKYRTMEEMRDAIDASGAEMVTVAIRRLPLDRPDEPNLMDHLDWKRYTILPNTAGCKTAEEALFTARLARELTGSDWVKLEVIPDPKYLLPDPIATLEAAQAPDRRRLRGAAVHPRRPRPRQAAGGSRLRDRDAAGLADRLRARHLHAGGDPDHHRERERARRR